MSRPFCFVRVFMQNCAIYFSKCQENVKTFCTFRNSTTKSSTRSSSPLFFRGDLIDSASLDTLYTISGFILALKIAYYCTSAATLVCQPQSAFVSPTVRTYYIVVCFRRVSLFILHIPQCLMNKYLYSVIHFGFDFSALY